MKVLVPIAGAADAKLILDFIANYCWPPGSEFRLMTIVDFDFVVDGVVPITDETASAEMLLKSVIHRTKRLLPNCSVSGEVGYGQAVDRIIERAHRWPADMVVMGYRVRNEAQRVLAGSVSRSVCMRAPCSVAVIRPPQAHNGNVLDHKRSGKSKAALDISSV